MAIRYQSYEIEPPLSPLAEISCHPSVDSIIQYAIGLQDAIDIDFLKSQISNSIMVKHPRFCSLLVQDGGGKRRWVPTQIDLSKHIIIVGQQPQDDHEKHICQQRPRGHQDEDDHKKTDDGIINEYIAGFAASSPLSPDKPLWEMHVLVKLRCLVLRIHHAIGDGTSIMSMICAMGRIRKQGDNGPDGGVNGDHIFSTKRNTNTKKGKLRCLRMIESNFTYLWYSMVFGAQLLAKILWLKDDETVINGGKGFELCPRKLVTTQFSLEDMKMVKSSINPNATINDVLLGVIWYGLFKYLDLQYHKAQVTKRLLITGTCKVNLRKQPGLQEMSTLMKLNSTARWGNKFGGFLLPIYYRKGSTKDPMYYVKKAKLLMDRKKQSNEAHAQYHASRHLVYLLGQNVAAWVFRNLSANTTFQISNIVGPPEEIVIFGNPVTFIRVNGYGLPQAIVIHMVSYAGSANLQILVAKDIVPDPELLADCFQQAFMEIKAAAINKIKKPAK